MKKIAFLLTLLITFQSCGFTPVYISKENINFKIKKITLSGDRELNNFINLSLKKYISKDNQNNGLEISAVTDYTRIAQSKDTKGNVQSFKVAGLVKFIITKNDQTFNFTYSEESSLNNSDDTFELNSFENSIKENFAYSMIEKLILDLSNRR